MPLTILPTQLGPAMAKAEIATAYENMEHYLSQNLTEYSTTAALDFFWDLALKIHAKLDWNFDEDFLRRTTESLVLFFERRQFDTKLRKLVLDENQDLDYEHDPDLHDVNEAAYTICVSDSQSPFLAAQVTPYRESRISTLEDFEKDHSNNDTTGDNFWIGFPINDYYRLRDLDPGLPDDLLDSLWPGKEDFWGLQAGGNRRKKSKVTVDDMWEDYMRDKTPLQRLRILKRMGDRV